MKRHILSFVAFAMCAFAPLFGQSKEDISMPSRQFFIENKGQWPSEVKYLTRIGGMDAWVTSSGITYDFYTFKKSKNPTNANDKFLKEDHERYGHVVSMSFKNSLEITETEAREQQPGHHNYLIGSDESKWARNVKLFKEVSLLKVYDGIDTRIYLDHGSLRYDMVLKAGADPAQIAMTFDGAEKVSINKKGELVLKTSLGDVVQQKLYAFQNIEGKRKKVECKFAFKNGEVGFDVGKFDKTKPLVIDPLIYSTYIGGSSGEQINAVAVDVTGSAYITGLTTSGNYPIILGAYKELWANSQADIFVTKFYKDGRSLDYSTFVGGKLGDAGFGIAVAKDSTVYVTGYTYSWGPALQEKFPVFPVNTTPMAYDTSHNSPGPTETMAADCFILRLDKFGSSLRYSTFVGGSMGEEAAAIALDRNGNVYITGVTNSGNLIPPAPLPGYDKTLGGGLDAFVIKMNATGSALLYGTYIGNTGPNTVITPPVQQPRPLDEFATGIAIDSLGNAYITGTTTSEKFPVTPTAYDTTIGRGRVAVLIPPPPAPETRVFVHADDIFVTKLNANGSGLLYSTFIGGDSSDYSYGIGVDKQGNAWITGHTESSTAVPADAFPTVNAFDNALAGSLNDKTDAVIVKINPTGSALLYSTFIGNSNDESARAIAIDSLGNSYITGFTNSTAFPTGSGLAEDKSYNGGSIDVFAMKFPSAGGAPTYSTFLGGADTDIGRAIAVDTLRDVYVAGGTYSSNFPVRSYGGRAYDSSYNNSVTNSEDGFISKFRMECNLALDIGKDTVICPGDSLLIGKPVVPGTGLIPYQYSFTPSPDLVANGFQAVVKPKVTTKYYLTATDRIGCIVRDSITVTVNPPIIAEAGGSSGPVGIIEVCAGQDTVVGRDASGGSGIFKYKWTPSVGLSSDTVSRPRLTTGSTTQKYFVVVTDSRGCTSVDSVNVIITNPISFASTAPASGLDFGELSACESDDSLTFTITNNSGRIVKVREYAVSNSAFKVTTPQAGFNLAADPTRADAKKTLVVKFAPQTQGAFSDSLQLITEPCGESYTIYLKGTKLESLVKADTNIYDFGTSYTCDPVASRDTIIIVRNSGTGTITVKALLIPFAYVLLDPPAGDFPKTLLAGEAISLKIGLTPPVGEAISNGILEVLYESQACPASSITIDLLSERVKVAADIAFKTILMPDITGCDTFRDTALVFTNTGTSESIAIKSMAPAVGLQLLTTLPLTIAAGDTELVRVRFSPDATTTSAQAIFTYGPCDETLTATLTGNRKGIAFQMPASIEADTVVLCKGSSSSGSASITNQSGVDVTLTENAVLNDPQGTFSITNLQAGAIFQNGTPRFFDYTFTPTAPGDYSATITLKFDLCEFDTTILLKATASDVQLTAQTMTGGTTLAMGVIASGSFKTDSVEVKNTGNSGVTLAQIAGLSSPFSIISPTAGYILQPNTSVWVIIRYDALSDGAFRDTLIVQSINPCDVLLKTEVTAGEDSNPVSIGKAQISIGNTITGSDTASSGTTVRIPLMIRSSENLIQSNTRNYTAIISFNKNLLKPAGTTPQGVVDGSGSRRTITVTGTRGSDTLGVLKELEFTAMLGDSACTDITIDSFTWTDGNATATTQNSEFCLTELCAAGGQTRLVSSGPGQFMLYQMKPNPVSQENTEIEYNLVERGHTTLTIINALGQTVKTIVNDQHHNAGHYSVNVQMQDIPSGLYLVVLKSPTQTQTQNLQVSK